MALAARPTTEAIVVYLTDDGWRADAPVSPARWGWRMLACVLAGWGIVALVLWALGALS